MARIKTISHEMTNLSVTVTVDLDNGMSLNIDLTGTKTEKDAKRKVFFEILNTGCVDPEKISDILGYSPEMD